MNTKNLEQPQSNQFQQTLEQPRCKNLVKLSYTLPETAQVTGLSERTIRRLIARGLLCKSLATRRIIVSHREVERFVNDTTTHYSFVTSAPCQVALKTDKSSEKSWNLDRVT